MQQTSTAAGFAFRRACQQGNMRAVQDFIRHGCDVESTADDGCTALWLAAEAGHAEVVEFLCSRGANVNAGKQSGHATPLFVAAQNGCLTAARVLLHYGADPNSCRDTGATPLFIAAQQGYLEMLQLLLDSGARAAIRNRQGVSPMMVAAYQGHVNCVLLLLEAGCDPYEVALGRNTIEWGEAGGFGKEVAQAVMQQLGTLKTEEKEENVIPWRSPSTSGKSNLVRGQHRDAHSYLGLSRSASETSGKTHDCRGTSLHSTVGSNYEPQFLLRKQQHSRSANTGTKDLSRQSGCSESVKSRGLRSSSHVVKSSSSAPSSRLQEMIKREIEENAAFEKMQRSRFQTNGSGKVFSDVSEPVKVKETHEKWEIWKQMLQERLSD
ncbi:ankyrin [Trypanosoma theileri]|uniref:Ankyrin n=1 Tax=Trypanosoma theileri TaxID=67003 RepID=A0A1X0NL60_9TRYP|nr:ankyrin [Trypanosoma theileri]ORC85377.1 ankyrin [Trypanosoma theileri]